jgi:hypothetical protein
MKECTHAEARRDAQRYARCSRRSTRGDVRSASIQTDRRLQEEESMPKLAHSSARSTRRAHAARGFNRREGESTRRARGTVALSLCTVSKCTLHERICQCALDLRASVVCVEVSVACDSIDVRRGDSTTARAIFNRANGNTYIARTVAACAHSSYTNQHKCSGRALASAQERGRYLDNARFS